jgi:hypothetical protein
VPNETARVIARTREVKPARVYFAVDGAREGRPEDAELVELTKQLAKEFDWACELRTAFQAKNLGCGLGVSTAISWALTIEESVIVLEDDILPDPSFSRFAKSYSNGLKTMIEFLQFLDATMFRMRFFQTSIPTDLAESRMCGAGQFGSDHGIPTTLTLKTGNRKFHFPNSGKSSEALGLLH